MRLLGGGIRSGAQSTITSEERRDLCRLGAPEGGFLYVAPGGIHGFKNSQDVAASMLILFAPGVAREKYFEELADIRQTGRTLTDDEWTDLFARHDQVNL